MLKSKSQLKIGVVLNYVNLLLGNLIPIFYTPIMLSLLGQEEYGLYKLSSSVTSYLSLLSMGIGSAVTRYLIKANEEEGKEAEERILGLFMVVFQVIAAITCVVGVVLTLNLDLFYSQSLSGFELSRMKILVFLMVCNMAISFSASPYVSVVSSHEKFVFLQLMNIISTCFVPILNIVVLFLGYASIGMAVSSLVVGIIVRIMYLYYVKRHMGIAAHYKQLPVHLIKEILIFSFWIFLSNVVAQLYNATDTVLIGAIPALATTGVAVYNIGAVFNSIVFSATTGISTLLAPRANRMVFSKSSNQELTEMTIKVGRIQCFIICLLVSGFISYGKPFLEFYVGKGYEDAYWVAILMMIPNVIPLVQSMCLSIIIAQNKHQFRSIVYLIIAILNVIGSWILLHIWGIIGAAVMTGVGLVLGQGFVMNWYYHKKTGLNMIRFWKQVGVIYIVPVMMCVVTIIISRYVNFYNLMNLIVGIGIFAIIYCVLNWCYIMNDYEKQLLVKPVYDILKKLSKKEK